MTPEQKQTLLEKLQQIEELLKGVHTTVEALELDVVTVPEQPPVEEPVEEETPTPVPNSKTPFSVEVLKFNGKVAYVHGDEGLVKDQTLIQFANGRTTNIVDVVKSDDGVWAITTSEQADDNTEALYKLAGKLATITDRYTNKPTPTTPIETPEVPSVVVPTEPTQPSDKVVANFVDMGGDWTGGIYSGSNKAGLLIENTPANLAAFVVGADVAFSDESKLTVESAEASSNYIKLFFNAKKLNKKLGSPATVSALVREAVAETPVVTLPSADLPTISPVSVSGGKKAVLACNVGMGQGGTSVLPGINGTHYRVASNADIDNAVNIGFKILRIGSVSERLFEVGQKAKLYRGVYKNGVNHSIEHLLAAGAYAGSKGVKVMWNLFHNYGGQSETGDYAGSKKWGSVGGPSVELFVKQWTALIDVFLGDTKACAATYAFDLMNEWVGVPDQVIFDCYQGVITARGKQCADKGIKISLNGRNYSSTSDFPNNTLFKNLKHPSGSQWIEMSPHLYLDKGSDGYYDQSDMEMDPKEAAVIGINRLNPTLKWVASNGWGMNIGENIVTGNLTNLLVGEEAVLRTCIESGVPVFIFGVSQDFGDNHHNLMLPINAPMLALIKKLIKEYGI
jgi:aryl-phospho-beta-D-glucosidase BglC (GH1 family)